MAEEYESVCLVKPEVFVYRIPPLTNNRGHNCCQPEPLARQFLIQVIATIFALCFIRIYGWMDVEGRLLKEECLVTIGPHVMLKVLTDISFL
ncbi:unnamed protein product [Wuchereria bancrofti]|uniref:Uncharacterized protein n=1 Tax=Wuchereria bancrofti TaxID=6293 RepID=A0A3P7DXI6_WUCBA|nr:unnamed protein product [Wuchereria bancrofti]